jgi:hypothetical protein
MANDYFHLDLASDTRKINIYTPPQTNELVEAAFHYISIENDTRRKLRSTQK